MLAGEHRVPETAEWQRRLRHIEEYAGKGAHIPVCAHRMISRRPPL